MSRWLCHACGDRFDEPDYSLVHVRIPLRVHGDDPSLPRGQVVKYKCPSCGSGNLAGAANPHPFTPKLVKRQ